MNNFFKYFVNKPFQMKLLFVLAFILFGFFISIISFYTLSYYQNLNIKNKMIEAQSESFRVKSRELKDKIDIFTSELKSLKSSNIFKEYINSNDKKYVIDLFNILMNTNKEIFQLRFIDSKGFEKIRLERYLNKQSSFVVKDKYLQYKGNRYYFKDISKLQEQEIWYSNLDLNIEHGEIQIPIVPTLRIGTPIYEGKEFKGVLIINIHFEELIEKFVQSPFYYVSIYDKDENFIHHRHPDNTGKVVDYSWSKYLKTDFNLEKHKKRLSEIIGNKDDYILNRSLEDIIPNGEGLRAYYEPKLDELKRYESSEKNYIFTVTFIILLLSIPLSFIISIIPNYLNDELFKTKKALQQEVNVIDEYVYLTVTNVEGKILDISQAYLSLTGYEKDEILDKKHNVFRHPDTKNEVYEDLWNTILSKKIWKGELKNLKKDGSEFTIDLIIKPNLDDNGELNTFTAYIQDLTHQKEVEKVSITDELTTIYNRRKFNQVFKDSLDQSKMYNMSFSMMILDIDFFKQYNDTYGHYKGDEVLKKVACELKKSAHRKVDYVFRLGGEEFGIIFSSRTSQGAKEFANKVKDSIEALAIEHKSSEISEVLTISIGVLYAEDISALGEKEIYSLCDKALYKAKHSGRNKVHLDVIS